MERERVLKFDCLLGRQSRMKNAATASAESYSAFGLVRRLLLDEALGHWRRYAMALALMGIAAGATALGAYLIGTLTNGVCHPKFSGHRHHWRARDGGVRDQRPLDLRRRRPAQLHRQ